MVRSGPKYNGDEVKHTFSGVSDRYASIESTIPSEGRHADQGLGL